MTDALTELSAVQASAPGEALKAVLAQAFGSWEEAPPLAGLLCADARWLLGSCTITLDTNGVMLTRQTDSGASSQTPYSSSFVLPEGSPAIILSASQITAGGKILWTASSAH